jgi:GDP-4-dehydro-6-deoxy-D-mannose reductase
MSRILITGGTGFVGTHLIEFLKPVSSHIVVLASRMSFVPQPGVEYIDADIRDLGGVRTVVQEVKPNEIYHLAAVSAVGDSWLKPRFTYEVNAVGAYNLFEAAMGLPSRPRILNVSTSQVYAPSSEMLTEESRVAPDNPYAASKAMAELLTVQYRRITDGGIVTARPFNHTGPGQTTNFVLPAIAKQFAEIELGVRPPRLEMGNVGVQRDFTDVRDVVRAYRILLERGRVGEAYNVCSGKPVDLAEVIKVFEDVTGLKVTIETQSSKVRPNETKRVCGNPKKIRDETGWSAQIPLRKTIEDLMIYWRSKCAVSVS